MRSRPVLAALAALALLLPACGGDGEGSDGASPTAASTGDDSAAELGEGVAAVVEGEEIPTELVESRVEAAAATPELAEVLEGEQGDQARAQLRANILTQLIANEIVVRGAEERGLEIDDEAISETRSELASQAGGEEAFEEQLETAGLDEEQLLAELEAVTALRLVQEDLEGEEPSPAASPDAAGTPDDAALRQWFVERLQQTDVSVAPEIGTWDATRGEVVPAGATAPPTAPQAPTTGDATAPAAPSPTATEG